jgi:hypothetical protein
VQRPADTTRLIEFGRFAARDRARRGDRKPETFVFLGFTHICATDRHGRFKLKRITSKNKMRAKLRSVVDRSLVRRRSRPPSVRTDGPADAGTPALSVPAASHVPTSSARLA